MTNLHIPVFADLNASSIGGNPPSQAVLVEYATTRNKYDMQPKAQSRSLDAFTKWLSKPRISVKKDGASFIPATFKPGGTRVDADVTSITMLVLDFDSGKIGMTDALAVVKSYRAVAYTSFSHSEACEKFRLIVFLTSPIPPQQFPAVWSALVNMFPAGSIDLSCSNPSHFYYLPACPEEQEHLFRVSCQEGSAHV